MGVLDGIRVTLETVTPLFLAGADPRGKPELRPPAFRGALRYWFRAAAGGALGGDIQAVARAEREVFGAAAGGGGASAVVVRVSQSVVGEPRPYTRNHAIRVVKNGRELQQPTGRDYLYWSMAESGNKDKGNYQAPKQYYPPGTRFTIELAARPGAPAAGSRLEEAVAALWLLVQLGGVGSRSRRAGGSLSAVSELRQQPLKFVLTGNSPVAIAEHLHAGLEHVRQVFAPQGWPSLEAPSSFDILHPKTSRIVVLGLWQSPGEAVEAIGAALRDFRTYRDPDCHTVWHWLHGGRIPTVERAAFGLPIPYRYSSTRAGVVQAQTRSSQIDRRASPLFLKVSRTADGKGVGVATVFLSQFLPAEAQLTLELSRETRRDLKAEPPSIAIPGDYELIERWIAKRFPQRAEVRYA